MKNVKAQRVTSAPPPLDSPDDLFLQVLHALEGEETHRRRVLTAGNGVQDVSFDSFGPDRWIDRATRGRIDAIPLLAIILHATMEKPNRAAERRIVEGWAARVRQAVEAGELTARDPVTLLPLGTLPDGWGWCVSVGDADAFVQGLGMAWTCSGVVAALAEECTDPDTLAIEHLFSRPAEQPAAPVSAPLPPKPTGPTVTKKELVDGLDLVGSEWDERLKRIDRDGKQYLPAIVQRGRRGSGGSPLWNPVIFTRLAVQAGHLNNGQARARFKKAWPQWQDEIDAEMGEI